MNSDVSKAELQSLQWAASNLPLLLEHRLSRFLPRETGVHQGSPLINPCCFNSETCFHSLAIQSVHLRVQHILSEDRRTQTWTLILGPLSLCPHMDHSLIIIHYPSNESPGSLSRYLYFNNYLLIVSSGITNPNSLVCHYSKQKPALPRPFSV